MVRRTISKKNRQNGIPAPRQTGKAGRPYSKAAKREAVLALFHEQHMQVGQYPATRWVKIDEEE